MRRGIAWCLALSILQLIVAGKTDAAGMSATTGRTVTGSVKDALGRPMENVSVTLQTRDGRTMATTTTDSAGHFQFSNISHGLYSVSATKKDFKQALSIVNVTAAGARPVEMAMISQGPLSLELKAQKL